MNIYILVDLIGRESKEEFRVVYFQRKPDQRSHAKAKMYIYIYYTKRHEYTHWVNAPFKQSVNI